MVITCARFRTSRGLYTAVTSSSSRRGWSTMSKWKVARIRCSIPGDPDVMCAKSPIWVWPAVAPPQGFAFRQTARPLFGGQVRVARHPGSTRTEHISEMPTSRPSGFPPRNAPNSIRSPWGVRVLVWQNFLPTDFWLGITSGLPVNRQGTYPPQVA